MVVMCQRRMLEVDKCTILVGDVDGGGVCACVVAGSTWDTSTASSQFCCKHKITVKKKSLFLIFYFIVLIFFF